MPRRRQHLVCALCPQDLRHPLRRVGPVPIALPGLVMAPAPPTTGELSQGIGGEVALITFEPIVRGMEVHAPLVLWGCGPPHRP